MAGPWEFDPPRSKPLVEFDIKVQHMQHTIRSAIYDQADEIARQIDESVKTALANDVLKAEVVKAVKYELDKVLREAIKSTVVTVVYSSEVQLLIKKAIKQSLKAILDEKEV